MSKSVPDEAAGMFVLSRAEQRLAKRYFLGEMEPDEQEIFEERYFREDDFYQAVCAEEDALIDMYVCERLARGDRVRFDRYYMASPIRAAKTAEARRIVQAARVLAGSRFESSRQFRGHLLNVHPRMVPILLASACLILTATSSWFVGLKSSHQSNKAAGGTSRGTSEETMPIVESLLEPGLTKGDEEVKRTRLPASAVGIRVVLTLGQSSAYMSYRASISAPDSAFPLWSQAGLAASRRGATDVVILLVPTTLFTGTDYICRLERSRDGVHFEALNSYRLAVSRKSSP